MKTGSVYWFTGMSGVGKSTLASLFCARLKAQGGNAVYLDGDILREVFGNDLGHTNESRLKSAMRNARLCKLLSDQGVDVVCATISLFHSCQQWNRANIASYREIFIEAPIEVLKGRDPKKIYAQAASGTVGDVAGIHFEVQNPKNPELHLQNDGSRTPHDLVDEIWNHFFPLVRKAAAR